MKRGCCGHSALSDVPYYIARPGMPSAAPPEPPYGYEAPAASSMTKAVGLGVGLFLLSRLFGGKR
jgi:hypothetical protein